MFHELSDKVSRSKVHVMELKININGPGNELSATITFNLVITTLVFRMREVTINSSIAK